MSRRWVLDGLWWLALARMQRRNRYANQSVSSAICNCKWKHLCFCKPSKPAKYIDLAYHGIFAVIPDIRDHPTTTLRLVRLYRLWNISCHRCPKTPYAGVDWLCRIGNSVFQISWNIMAAIVLRQDTWEYLIGYTSDNRWGLAAHRLMITSKLHIGPERQLNKRGWKKTC